MKYLLVIICLAICGCGNNTQWEREFWQGVNQGLINHNQMEQTRLHMERQQLLNELYYGGY
jgi:hypothetical protein